MTKGKKIAALVVAGGTGTRLGGDIPKQYLPLQGMTVLQRSLIAFKAHPMISHVVAAIHPDHQDLYAQASASLDLPPPVFGGNTRQESVRKGLEALRVFAPDIVLIHDAARPLVSEALISDLCLAAEKDSAAIPGIALSDTVKRNEGREKISTIPRDNLYAVQTPQAFAFALIDRLHEKYSDRQVTDDAGLVETEGLPVKIVPGAHDNIKITHGEDLITAEKILLNRLSDIRNGTGFDVHRLIPITAGRPLMLCGIAVPHSFTLEGHSDADVGLHAITDAILGALGEGDIGHHFSPHDMRWKDVDSALFLRHAADMVAKKGGVIAHVDVTLICEAPKIGPHRDKMRARIADILSLPLSRVSVKATTTEGLGFTGRGEGIAAQSSVTIRLS